ncbi:MAG: family 20 glycosylhydrolase [bacterium]
MELTSQFKVKGFHLDLRIQVMTMPALKKFAKELAGFGLNTLIMEWEGAYPFNKHATISNQYAYTRDQIKYFIQYCSKCGIDVIPLQQCFGHSEYMLRHYRYAYLREDQKDISQICALKKDQAHKLFSEIFSDISSLHPSPFFHVGGDETYLLGHCKKCSDYVKKHGKSRLFVNYIKMICDIVIGLGKRPILWADIILKYPQALSQLPKKTVFIDWNYGWAINNFGNISNLQKQGCEIWGAPALRSSPDNFYLTCWQKHFNNIKDFIPYARKAGYKGIIMTSWSTSGEYGYEWDHGWEVKEIHAIRNVYPLSGFRILLAAYAKAFDQINPIIPVNFVADYAHQRFGLNIDESTRLWRILNADSSLIINGKSENGKSIKSVLGNIDKALCLIMTLKPRINKNEFEHFKLMLEIRRYYLAIKVIESGVQSSNFTIKQRHSCGRELKNLFKIAINLDKRFHSLNRDFLYDSEIKKENKIRNQALYLLYNKIAGKK